MARPRHRGVRGVPRTRHQAGHARSRSAPPKNSRSRATASGPASTITCGSDLPSPRSSRPGSAAAGTRTSVVIPSPPLPSRQRLPRRRVPRTARNRSPSGLISERVEPPHRVLPPSNRTSIPSRSTLTPLRAGVRQLPAEGLGGRLHADPGKPGLSELATKRKPAGLRGHHEVLTSGDQVACGSVDELSRPAPAGVDPPPDPAVAHVAAYASGSTSAPVAAVLDWLEASVLRSCGPGAAAAASTPPTPLGRPRGATSSSTPATARCSFAYSKNLVTAFETSAVRSLHRP